MFMQKKTMEWNNVKLSDEGLLSADFFKLCIWLQILNIC